ncbi:DUF6270 domain-containing protein [Glutamicibacter sp. HZAU]|uniref:DUF6270 domain-containing protein n=1 Tax=Glutamicibacter sp. HZAU TaxID=2049891 RepID=UPI000FFB7FF4|nr:DUF6270 domain-containing protein [Glutamicibacter sp. HZAU]RWZ83753.1 hypothetical protein EKH49_08080 [Glutamicibacter sp. HZAU]
MTRVFIYGGCTSRDAVEYYQDYDFELLTYVARQSLISAFMPADPQEFVIPHDAGAFQKRMLAGDIVGNLPSQIRRNAKNTNLLVWDLMIERVGVTKVRSGGFVTRNGIKKTPGTAPSGGTYEFGTTHHLRLWSWALGKFVRLLEQNGLKEKVVINATPWATHDTNGNLFRSRSPMTADWFNSNVEKYWTLAEDAGIKVARISQELVIADPNHKWGPAYFHYASQTYKAQLETISAIL